MIDLQGKKASMTIALTNNGILPAVARVSMEPHACFQLGSGPQLITLASKQCHRLAVDFIASAVKQHTHEVMLITLITLPGFVQQWTHGAHHDWK